MHSKMYVFITKNPISGDVFGILIFGIHVLMVWLQMIVFHSIRIFLYSQTVETRAQLNTVKILSSTIIILLGMCLMLFSA